MKDSLHEDNCAYALKDQVSTSKATLIGEGNTYIEKAYLAVTGENLSKAKTTDALDSDDPGVCIFDADTAVQESNQQKARMIFCQRGKERGKKCQPVRRRYRTDFRNPGLCARGKSDVCV